MDFHFYIFVLSASVKSLYLKIWEKINLSQSNGENMHNFITEVHTKAICKLFH